MEVVDSATAPDLEDAVGLVANLLFGVAEGGVIGVDLVELGLGQVVADGVGDHEVAVGQTLHQRTRAQEKLASPSTCRPGMVLMRL